MMRTTYHHVVARAWVATRRMAPFIFVALILWLQRPIPYVDSPPYNDLVTNNDETFLTKGEIESTIDNRQEISNLTTTTPPSWCDKPLRLLPRTLRNITLLASYPGSGNTWMRHLIQRGSRVLTGSAYNDTSLTEQFPGEGRKDGTVIVVKTHYPCFSCWTLPHTGRPVTDSQSGKRSYVLANAALVIVRNPFNAILSEFNRIFSGFNHTGVVSKDAMWDGGPKGLFTSFVRKRAISWLRHTNFYLASKKLITTRWTAEEEEEHSPLLGMVPWKDENGQLAMVMYYEQIQKAPILHLQSIFSFLKTRRRRELLNLDPMVAAQCALAESVGGFKRQSRTHVVGNRDPFSQVFEDPPPVDPPDPTDSWNWRAPTRAEKAGETLREMMCRMFEKVWQEEIWGKCHLG